MHPMPRLVLFAKRPRPGHVKTRLIPAIGRDRALVLYRAFVADQLRFLRSFRRECDVELCADGPWSPDPEFDPLLGSVTVTRQGAGDLGRRLLRCFERARAEGARATVVLGTDSPTLPAGHVREALDALDSGAPAVVCPASDGGYVLVGLLRPLAELFREVPWGGPDVLAVTFARARSHGIALRTVTPWYDIDDADDLERLRNELAAPAARRRAPATTRALAGMTGPVV
jgi:rSAM/selenodomain-associated transferase 1